MLDTGDYSSDIVFESLGLALASDHCGRLGSISIVVQVVLQSLDLVVSTPNWSTKADSSLMASTSFDDELFVHIRIDSLHSAFFHSWVLRTECWSCLVLHA